MGPLVFAGAAGSVECPDHNGARLRPGGALVATGVPERANAKSDQGANATSVGSGGFAVGAVQADPGLKAPGFKFFMLKKDCSAFNLNLVFFFK